MFVRLEPASLANVLPFIETINTIEGHTPDLQELSRGHPLPQGEPRQVLRFSTRDPEVLQQPTRSLLKGARGFKRDILPTPSRRLLKKGVAFSQRNLLRFRYLDPPTV